jgi:hypothetical protein
LLILSCSDGDDDDDDDEADCIACESTAECTAALGEGWGCIDDCCEYVAADDDEADDDAADDDTPGDDDAAEDDDDDDNDDQTPGAPEWIIETVASSARATGRPRSWPRRTGGCIWPTQAVRARNARRANCITP